MPPRGKPKERLTTDTHWRKLFRSRLGREKRLMDFQKRRGELYRSEEWKGGWKNTWMVVAREFGFHSKRDEIERFERYMMEKRMDKLREQIEREKEELRREREQEAVAAIPDIGSLDLPPDIAWVYSHPAMIRPSGNGEVVLQECDLVGAPSKGAIGMLQFYVNNKRDFYKTVLSHLTRRDAAGQEDREMEDDLRDAKEIDAMLSQI